MNADRARAESLTRWPALILLVCAVIHILLVVLSFAFGGAAEEWLAANAPDYDQAGSRLADPFHPINLISTGITIVLLVLAIVGALQMMKLGSWGLALTAAIVACVPCVGVCCGLTLPIGVWALIVLMKPEVKQSFT